MENRIIEKIITEYGTPIYVLAERILENSANEFEVAFSNISHPVHIAYPYKANFLQRICLYMLNRDYWSEVSSEIELEAALSICDEPREIIYNGPYKPDRALNKALSSGCLINIDNIEEAGRIAKILSQSDTSNVNLGIRVSNVGSLWDKFGFQIGDEAITNLRRIKAEYCFPIRCLHIHKSNIGNLIDYKRHLSTFFDFVDLLLQKDLIDLKCLDLGSGFAINYPTPKAITEWDPPRIEEYSQLIDAELKKRSFPSELEIIIEPGRKLVASSMTLFTKIVSIKNRGHEKIVIVDAGSNLIPGDDYYNYPILQIDKNSRLSEPGKYNIHGCLCDSLDIIGQDVALYKPAINEILSINCVGGYDISRSFYWQVPRPNIIWVNKDLSYDLIRREENIFDIRITENK